MIKRYLATLGGFLLLTAIYLATLLPLLLVRADVTSATFLRSMTVWGLLALFSLGPALSFLIKRIWFFRGKGQAVALHELRQHLLAINEIHCPVRVKEKGKRLIVEWRYDDPEWCEYMAAANVTRLYEVLLGLDESTNTVTFSDRGRKIDLSLCPIRIKTGFLSRPRLFFGIKIGKDRGVNQYSMVRPTDFRFKAQEIKTPIVNTILGHGWNVRFSLL